ncbi:MAG: hypothetical protein NVS3B16_14420 [Vulcanimicrobiaceae bacterium]
MKSLSSSASGDPERARTDVVDGFRGLAIGLVLVYHTWLFSWFTPELAVFGLTIPVDALARTGYLGVDLFFTISGFVLFLPWARRAVANGSQPPLPTRAFAYRRFIKIVPSYAVAFVVSLASAASLHFPLPLGATVAEHAFFVPNFVTSPLGRANSVFWSLGIEVQFYLVFPLLARAFARRPVAVAVAMFAGALAYRYGVAGCCLVSEPINRQVPAFFDVFAAGMLAAYGVAAVERRAGARARVRSLATLAAVAAVGAGLALVLSANAIQYDRAGRETWILVNRTFVAVAAGSALFGSCFAARAWRALVANPLTRFLSLISYNLYLWHTLVLIWLWKHRALSSATADPHADPRWQAAFIAVGWTVAIGISTALTYLVERPLLATVKPQSFAFAWRRIMPGARAAPSERRT